MTAFGINQEKVASCCRHYLQCGNFRSPFCTWKSAWRRKQYFPRPWI